MELQIKQITENDFYDKYKPVQNHLDKDAGWGGELYETFGEELMYCFELAKKENRVWTVIECDDVEYDPDYDEDDEYNEEDEPKACMCITSGFHLVNRIGFMVTEVPYEEKIEIKLDL
jgi:hypothetical protein